VEIIFGFWRIAYDLVNKKQVIIPFKREHERSEKTFFAKEIRHCPLTDKDIDDCILLLNLTPRKVLEGLTPLEAFIGRRVALIT